MPPEAPPLASGLIAISTSVGARYISRVWGFRVLEACRLKHSARSLWKRTRLLSVLIVWISFPPYAMLLALN